jgi:ankyrin repeat protein
VVEFLLAKGADANAEVAGFSALHCAIMRRDEKMALALLDHGANPNAPLRTWTPTRRSSADNNFEPPLVGSTPFWLAARFTQPGLMRVLLKRGADPLFIHRSTYWAGEPAEERQQTTTVVMAAAGMGGGAAWSQPARAEREDLTLEAIQIAVDLGVDVNIENSDGRTALDAAMASRFDKVVKYLESKGAKLGTVIKGKPLTIGRPLLR